MEEKVLIKSEQYNIKKALKITLIIGAVISAIMLLNAFIDNLGDYDSLYETYSKHQNDGDCGYWYESWETCWSCEEVRGKTKIGFAISETFEEDFIFCLSPFAALALIGGLIYGWLHSYELTVTDKRIYGKVAWGKRVDLPVDSISAIATVTISKGVSVSTSSGRISFLIIKNADEIYKIMNNLLIKRQQEKADSSVSATAPKNDEADQLKKYKDLLDSGVITQEEFDAKKKQLLGL